MAAYAQGGIKYARKHLQRVWLWLKQPHAILPTHDLRRLVHLCSIGAGLWTAIISPILLAVPLQVEQENAPRLWAPWAPQVIIISTICDAVLCCEALLCATTAYHVHTSQGATVHMERRIVKTASRYLRSWWSLIDAVSAMPAAITLFLILAAEGGAHTAAGAIALVRIMLLLKGVSAVRLFVLLHQKLDARRSTPSATAQQLLFLLLATFFVWHWASCIFLAIAATSSAGARVQMSQSMTPAGSPTLVDQANRSQVTQVADSARNQTGMSCVQDKEALLAASLSVQYHCALVWASHIVSLSGGHDSAPWGAGERLEGRRSRTRNARANGRASPDAACLARVAMCRGPGRGKTAARHNFSAARNNAHPRRRLASRATAAGATGRFGVGAGRAGGARDGCRLLARPGGARRRRRSCASSGRPARGRPRSRSSSRSRWTAR